MTTKPLGLCDTNKEQLFQKSLVTQVQGDLTGITITFKINNRLVAIACPINFEDFGHVPLLDI